MRNLFWLLLLANAILFAVMQHGGFDWGKQEVKAQPELNSAMIRVLPEPQSLPVKPSSAAPAHSRSPIPAPPSPIPAPASMPAPAVAPAVPVPAPTPSPSPPHLAASEESKPDRLICLEWGDFSGSDLTRAKAVLSDLQVVDKSTQRQIERDIGYWVYMPPLKSKASVKRKIAELKALGINDYFVVQNQGHWQNAISLGVFKTRDAAENFLHALNTKGVRTAEVGERASKIITTVFVLKGVDAGIETKLKSIQKDFPGSELNDVSCGLTR